MCSPRTIVSVCIRGCNFFSNYPHTPVWCPLWTVTSISVPPWTAGEYLLLRELLQRLTRGISTLALGILSPSILTLVYTWFFLTLLSGFGSFSHCCKEFFLFFCFHWGATSTAAMLSMGWVSMEQLNMGRTGYVWHGAPLEPPHRGHVSLAATKTLLPTLITCFFF